MTLYLTVETTASEIAAAKASGFVHAVKWYPAGATTHSHQGVRDASRCDPAFAAMEAHGLPLLVHAETTDPRVDIFDREVVFFDRELSPVLRRFPRLRVVDEHVTTQQAVQFVRAAAPHVGATITAHHLLLNRNALFDGGLCPHHYFRPALKREKHQLAVLEAAIRASFWEPTVLRIRVATRHPPAAAPASTPRTRRSNCMPTSSIKPER